MPLYDDFPYTNFHSLNLDWIVKKISELENDESTENSSSSTATLARNLTGNYPYTNFHALNLDWVIRSMLELESDFETVENEWQSLRSTGLLNDEVKNAILQCFQNVAWASDQGRQYYNTLHDLFFPPVVVNTLTAILDQGDRVFHTGENINVIKDYLTVTAELSDGTLITVPATQYVLTGSLSQEGPNIIVVSYMNASTTITVNAVAVSLVSISAVYTQSGTVYDTDSLDSLKSDLVVTATYSDSSTATVPSADYTLNGTLAVGTSTITVSYMGITTTFNVAVTSNYNMNYLFSDLSLSDGYIGDDGNVVSAENNVFWDEMIKAKGFWLAGSNGVYYDYVNLYLRLAEYDSNGDFVARKAVQEGNPAVADSGEFIKMGANNFTNYVEQNADRFVACNILDTSICTIANKTIDANGDVQDNPGSNISDYLPINSGYMICQLVNSYDSALVVFYDSNHDLISRNAVTTSLPNKQLFIQVPNNTTYVRFRCPNTANSDIYVSYVK